MVFFILWGRGREWFTFYFELFIQHILIIFFPLLPGPPYLGSLLLLSFPLIQSLLPSCGPRGSISGLTDNALTAQGSISGLTDNALTAQPSQHPSSSHHFLSLVLICSGLVFQVDTSHGRFVYYVYGCSVCVRKHAWCPQSSKEGVRHP